MNEGYFSNVIALSVEYLKPMMQKLEGGLTSCVTLTNMYVFTKITIITGAMKKEIMGIFFNQQLKNTFI